MSPRTSAATEYSATGTALTAAALETRMPRSNTSGVMCPLTDPAAWMIALRSGMADSAAASMRGQPQPVSST
ncbi:MAG TPA: hypothetical protein VF062_10255 [Candidatus Limnocylindrales bacterium]